MARVCSWKQMGGRAGAGPTWARWYEDPCVYKSALHHGPVRTTRVRLRGAPLWLDPCPAFREQHIAWAVRLKLATRGMGNPFSCGVTTQQSCTRRRRCTCSPATSHSNESTGYLPTSFSPSSSPSFGPSLATKLACCLAASLSLRPNLAVGFLVSSRQWGGHPHRAPPRPQASIAPPRAHDADDSLQLLWLRTRNARRRRGRAAAHHRLPRACRPPPRRRAHCSLCQSHCSTSGATRQLRPVPVTAAVASGKPTAAERARPHAIRARRSAVQVRLDGAARRHPQ